MKRSVIETLLGAGVLLVAIIFLMFGYSKAEVGKGADDGYVLSADFSGIGGLKPGDDVQISGVKVGTVSAVTLLPDTYLARVTLSLEAGMALPVDTAAAISSESLMGGRYLALEPGAEDDTIPSGGAIQYTQAPQNLEQLLGQFIFSMKDAKDKKQSETENESEDSAASVPESAPPSVNLHTPEQP